MANRISGKSITHNRDAEALSKIDTNCCEVCCHGHSFANMVNDITSQFLSQMIFTIVMLHVHAAPSSGPDSSLGLLSLVGNKIKSDRIEQTLRFEFGQNSMLPFFLSG